MTKALAATCYIYALCANVTLLKASSLQIKRLILPYDSEFTWNKTLNDSQAHDHEPKATTAIFKTHVFICSVKLTFIFG